MNDYVFIDSNNGHFNEYYNFRSDASSEQIEEATKSMRNEHPLYGRLGSKVDDLADKLIELGFVFIPEESPRNKRYIDRIAVDCISGNY